MGEDDGFTSGPHLRERAHPLPKGLGRELRHRAVAHRACWVRALAATVPPGLPGLSQRDVVMGHAGRRYDTPTGIGQRQDEDDDRPSRKQAESHHA